MVNYKIINEVIVMAKGDGMKTLVLNGSPKKNGDTEILLSEVLH